MDSIPGLVFVGGSLKKAAGKCTSCGECKDQFRSPDFPMAKTDTLVAQKPARTSAST